VLIIEGEGEKFTDRGIYVPYILIFLALSFARFLDIVRLNLTSPSNEVEAPPQEYFFSLKQE
jgi:hypothetical protein